MKLAIKMRIKLTSYVWFQATLYHFYLLSTNEGSKSQCTVFTVRIRKEMSEQKSVDPDQSPHPHSLATDLGLHCLSLIQQFLDTLTGSQIDLFKFYQKYGKDFMCLNI